MEIPITTLSEMLLEALNNKSLPRPAAGVHRDPADAEEIIEELREENLELRRLLSARRVTEHPQTLAERDAAIESRDQALRELRELQAWQRDQLVIGQRSKLAAQTRKTRRRHGRQSGVRAK